jgi:hypothetical protein
MKKSEAKPVIEHLIDDWLRDQGFPFQNQKEPSSSSFYTWLQDKHPNYLRFRTTTLVRYDVEMWFDQAVRRMRIYWASMQPARDKPDRD